MKRALIIYSVMFLILAVSAVSLIKNFKPLLFPNPQNLAQKVANFVVQNGEKGGFNVGVDTEGVFYRYQFYKEHSIYEVELWIYNDKKIAADLLNINHYVTNLFLETLKSPADLLANELKYGRHKINIEEYVSDTGIDAAVDIYQQFTKKNGFVFEGFTREERDLGITNPSKFGVKEYIFSNGKERLDKKWIDASDQTKKEIQKQYFEHLKTIASHLNIK